MSAGIVDSLEIINVEKEHAEFFLQALHAADLTLKNHRQITLIVKRR